MQETTRRRIHPHADIDQGLPAGLVFFFSHNTIVSKSPTSTLWRLHTFFACWVTLVFPWSTKLTWTRVIYIYIAYIIKYITHRGPGCTIKFHLWRTFVESAPGFPFLTFLGVDSPVLQFKRVFWPSPKKSKGYPFYILVIGGQTTTIAIPSASLWL